MSFLLSVPRLLECKPRSTKWTKVTHPLIVVALVDYYWRLVVNIHRAVLLNFVLGCLAELVSAHKHTISAFLSRLQCLCCTVHASCSR